MTSCALVLKRYGTADSFSQTFHPQFADKYARHQTRCVIGNAPTLMQMQVSYGVDFTGKWMQAQLFVLGEIVGPAQRMNDSQIRMLASSIVSNYEFLKATDIMLFVSMFRAGRFGHFYGNVDPLVITSALNDNYLPYRMQLIADAQKRRLHEERERLMSDPNLISITEYCERKTLNEEQASFLTTFIANDDLERKAIIESYKRGQIPQNVDKTQKNQHETTKQINYSPKQK